MTPKILKGNRDIFSNILSSNGFNNFMSNAKFPGNLKYADIILAIKIDDRPIRLEKRTVAD